MSHTPDTNHSLVANCHSSLHPICPNCGSFHIEQKNYGKRAGGALGSVAGALGSIYGSSLSLIKDRDFPSSSVTILGALAGIVAGCAAGAALGQTVDETMLDNYHCLRCDHSFQPPNR